MFLVRPAEGKDAAALERLAAVVTPGVHTLPRSRHAIDSAIEHSLASFAANVDGPGDESYLFVLESDGKVCGTAAVAATAGSSATFFAFRNDVIQQVSRDLAISHNVHALTLCSDLTGYSQLSGFYVQGVSSGEIEGREQAALLSRSRLLYAAVAPQRFSERFFASLSGMSDANARSPFWEALGRKFFQMDFLEAEDLIDGARNRSLIVELMPHYPVYVPLLPGDAQAAMGQVHAEGVLPFRILSDEGFEPDEYIDIFDGGPILQAHKQALRSFSSSMLRKAAARVPGDEDSPHAVYLVATVREHGFRAIVTECQSMEFFSTVALSPQALDALRVATGDTVICVKL